MPWIPEFLRRIQVLANRDRFHRDLEDAMRPHVDPDRLVTVLHRGTNPVAPANYLDWRAQNSSFEDMAAAEFWTPNLTGGDHPEQLWGLRFTPNMLPMLGVEPLAGRWFSASEGQK